MVTNRFHRRGAHLLAFTTPRDRFCFGLLAVVLPETRIHIVLNGRGVLQYVGYNTLLQRPPEEVQLTHSGFLNLGLAVDLERNTLAATERIKQPLTVRFELTLVLEMDDELFVIQEVGHIELLGIVCDEPLHHAETNRCGARQEW